ncbi:hypothetical protein Y023_328 [Burkholderia pseudomallei A79D]|nr:hypothetical protein X995_1186 [Burkholderia pseudomallei B03]AIV94805.1 hypothetical protein X996_1137 [Burkholderia pseudomallei A79A]KGY05556.1 hypothetical protein Y023_328 [Burkholderia pseudomallei A79D]KGY06552.1 hypothetical protein X997_323 [Burkholderia pseudomallei A79C]
MEHRQMAARRVPQQFYFPTLWLSVQKQTRNTLTRVGQIRA